MLTPTQVAVLNGLIHDRVQGTRLGSRCRNPVPS
jgi:hypothetical protein